jgi:hypothetical protein
MTNKSGDILYSESEEGAFWYESIDELVSETMEDTGVFTIYSGVVAEIKASSFLPKDMVDDLIDCAFDNGYEDVCENWCDQLRGSQDGINQHIKESLDSYLSSIGLKPNFHDIMGMKEIHINVFLNDAGDLAWELTE